MMNTSTRHGASVAAPTTRSRVATTTPVSIDSLLDAVAAKKGKRAQTDALAAALAMNGIQHVCELEQLDRGDWDALNVSMGLKAAIKSELTMRSHAATETDDMEVLPATVCHFLLISDADGNAPTLIGSIRSMYLGILTVAPADRQQLAIILGEMLALVSGLFLAIPISLQRTEPAPSKGWDRPPSLDDGMNALAGFSFVTLALTSIMSVFFAIFVSAAGWRGSFAFYDSAMSMVNAIVVLFTTAFFATVILVFWQLFTVASCPYPLIGALVVFQILAQIMTVYTAMMLVDAMPLEVYHWPRWYRNFMIRSVPTKSMKERLSDAMLKPAAERRAAELRARMGIEPELCGSRERDLDR